MGCTWSSVWYAIAPAPTVTLEGRRFRLGRLLGEGGYAYVHLAVEEPGAREAAVKRVYAQSPEQLERARAEVAALRRVVHPAVVRLLCAAEVEERGEGGLPRTAVCMAFPYYELGTLHDARTAAPLGATDVLACFADVAAGVAAMHALAEPLAHRDVKPLNVLLSRPAGPDAPMRAVVADLGSCVPARRAVRSRREALEVQEYAEAHTSAAYRAPELWDCPSECVIDERVDAWALGCTLFFAMYGESPFELGLGGGSLALAVLGGRVRWPEQPAFSDDLKALVTSALTADPAARPHAAELAERARALLHASGGAPAAGPTSCGPNRV